MSPQRIEPSPREARSRMSECTPVNEEEKIMSPSEFKDIDFEARIKQEMNEKLNEIKKLLLDERNSIPIK